MNSDTHAETSNMSFKSWGSTGLLLALLGGGISVAAFSSSPNTFFESYLYAFIFWFGLTLGCLALTCLHSAIRGSWSLAFIRLFEAGGGPTMILIMAVMFLPLVIGAPHLYSHWYAGSHEGFGHFKDQWLQPQFFVIRAFIYFAIYFLFAWKFRTSSVTEDETLDAGLGLKRQSWGAAGLVFFMITNTLMITDWVMSIDPKWSSSMMGAWSAISEALTALAVCTVIVLVHRMRKPYANIVTPALQKDFGNMLFTFTMLWAYTTLSQFLIIWSGNLPELITFYADRNQGGYLWLGFANVMGSWFLPWMLLLSPRIKRDPKTLLFVAVWIIAFRAVDWFWIVMPFFRGHLHWADFAAFLFLGGVWVTVFGRETTKAELLPKYDERLIVAAEAAH